MQTCKTNMEGRAAGKLIAGIGKSLHGSGLGFNDFPNNLDIVGSLTATS